MKNNTTRFTKTILSFVACILLAQTAALTSKAVPAQKHNGIKIVLFDIHSVILKPRAKKRIKLFLKHRKYMKTRWYFGFLPIISKATSERSIVKARNNPTRQKVLLEIVNAVKPITGTVNIIGALAKIEGLELHLGTNLGATAFADLINRDVFKPIFVPFNIEKSKFITYKRHEKTIKKPNPKFFSDYLDNLNTNFSMAIKPHEILFIDDKKKNIHAAQKIGMQTIHFTGNCYKLQKQLEAKLSLQLYI